MAKTERELTVPERRSIRKLVTGNCANYDKEYGCLPLDCECPMLGICYTNSAMCRYFRKSVLPNDPALEAALQALPTKRCQHCGKPFPVSGRRVYCSDKCADGARKSRPLPECESTGAKRQCNALTPKKPCGARTFGIGSRKVIQIYFPTQNCPANGYRAQNKNQEIRK